MGLLCGPSTIYVGIINAMEQVKIKLKKLFSIRAYLHNLFLHLVLFGYCRNIRPIRWPLVKKQFFELTKRNAFLFMFWPLILFFWKPHPPLKYMYSQKNKPDCKYNNIINYGFKKRLPHWTLTLTTPTLNLT